MIRYFLIGILAAIISACTLSVSYTNAQGFGSATYVNTIQVPGATAVTGSAANDALASRIVQRAINRVLGILALIALILLLRGGFQMLTAAGDEDKYKKGFTILKQMAIGLIFIGLAWFVVSMVFYLIAIIAK